jgi:hypothetical protein
MIGKDIELLERQWNGGARRRPMRASGRTTSSPRPRGVPAVAGLLANEDTMNEHIQTSPSPTAADPMVDQLLLRVQALEDSKKRWRMLALSLLLLLVLTVVGGTLTVMGVGSIYVHYVQREEMRLREMEAARQQAEMARMQAEAARAQLEREEARRAAEK